MRQISFGLYFACINTADLDITYVFASIYVGAKKKKTNKNFWIYFLGNQFFETCFQNFTPIMEYLKPKTEDLKLGT